MGRRFKIIALALAALLLTGCDAGDLVGTVISGATVAAGGWGGIFGLFGSGIGAIFKFFQAKQEHEFEKDKWDREDRLYALQLQRNREEDEHELAVVAQEGSWGALDSSMRAASKVGESYRWVNAIKALFRPLLTLVLIGIVYAIFRDLMSVLQGGMTLLAGAFTGEEAAATVRYIINSMVFSSSTAIVWWFGDRAFAPPGLKNR